MSTTTNNFTLTKSHVLAAFAPLHETSSLPLRSRFFTHSVSPDDVIWTITGPASSLSGTRHSIEAHGAATFSRLRERLVAPIKFTVTRVVVDAHRSEDGWWAVVEVRGEATRRSSGEPYNNAYVWVTRFNDEGKIVEVRSYFDTLLAEQVLQEEPEVEQ